METFSPYFLVGIRTMFEFVAFNITPLRSYHDSKLRIQLMNAMDATFWIFEGLSHGNQTLSNQTQVFH
jgi:hypothetical protein